MKLPAELQPDQQGDRWDNHVAVYEKVFEPLSNLFARPALDCLDLQAGKRLLDVGSGSGGAALAIAERGVNVFAVDASAGMVKRLNQRAENASGRGRIEAQVMDGMMLELPDACFDAALSVFGVILFPDASRGMREIARVLKPNGRAAVVTWTESERYELVGRLLAANAEIRGPQPPPASLPAQLRFRDEEAFRRLISESGLHVEKVMRLEERWRLPSARWIADHIAFAPGMSAMADAMGAERSRILDSFVSTLERDQGQGEVFLTAVAQAAVAVKHEKV